MIYPFSSGSRHQLIAGPSWKGAKPEGIDTVTTTDAEIAFAIFRTQLFNPADLENVKRIQDQYAAQTLSAFLGKTPPDMPPSIDFPAWDDKALDENFIPLLNFMLQFTTPTPDEKAIRKRIAEIGIGRGKPFDWDALPEARRKAIEARFAAARDKIAAHYMIMRLYWPKPDALDGTWQLPPVKPVAN